YDVKIGIACCKERIVDKIWNLEGYRLQSKLHDIKEFQKKSVGLLSEEKIDQTIEKMLNN
ncbi:Gp49 family protein, partial [Halomonas sp. SIMBA_159]